MQSVIACRSQDPQFAAIADPMYALRYRVFHERLGWDVKPVGEQEIDRFDNLHSVYLVNRDEDERVIGGWRLLPTTVPYMLRDVFPELLDGQAAPEQGDVWEISRFAFEKGAGGSSSFGFRNSVRDLLAETTRFALANGILRYVLVVSTAIERLLRNTGIVLHRYAPPRMIGEVRTVACWVDIDAHTCATLLGAGEAGADDAIELKLAA